jgi:hypothetical protein
MAVKFFSFEEIMQLKLSPYVVEATERFVYFSAEFKQRFYDEYKNGKKLRAIMEDMQINPDILGMTRIYGLRVHVLDEAERGQGFSDMRNHPFRDKLFGMSPDDKIRKLEHELAYTRQELGFLKNIITAHCKAEQS